MIVKGGCHVLSSFTSLPEMAGGRKEGGGRYYSRSGFCAVRLCLALGQVLNDKSPQAYYQLEVKEVATELCGCHST